MKWYGDLKSFGEKDVIIALVGNKVDLLDKNSRRREVGYEEGKALAKANKMLFYEASALTSLKVNDCFEDLLQEIYNERRKVCYRGNNINNSSSSSSKYINNLTLIKKDKNQENEGGCC